MKRLIILLLMTSLIFTGCQTKAAKNNVEDIKTETQTESTGESNPAEGIDLSDLVIKTYDGKEINKETYKNNKVTVLNLWGTWCGPCVEEMPDFEKVSQAYKDKGVEILGLALDSSEDEVKELKDTLKITYPLLKENDQTKEILSSKFDYVPVTLFIDSEGKVLKSFIAGGTDEAGLTKAIEALINE
ncbi:TlpA family protein disulfide reductase [Acidaminobacter sp. JC074]|uniref:TlpA family protein disulfide reductase n=1 Tax=Acidaminobacter sp. JC074 TaxID=2530199 RepID=UPI001F0F5347|nr:TlpA disulfide reductase family protein [Acidaminobacter sp. JC074]MCH4887974.1 TlpA family protein disulfide reductase [Acidaminobacter sp. JC074]